jgi:hypothetical protein
MSVKRDTKMENGFQIVNGQQKDIIYPANILKNGNIVARNSKMTVGHYAAHLQTPTDIK